MNDVLNQWIAFIDRERRDLLKMAKKKNELLQEAECEYKVLTGKERRQRMAFLKLVDLMEEKSLRKVLKEEVREEVKEEVKKEVKEKIKKENQLEIAKNMIEEKFPIEQIEKLTGLTKNEIKKHFKI